MAGLPWEDAGLGSHGKMLAWAPTGRCWPGILAWAPTGRCWPGLPWEDAGLGSHGCWPGLPWEDAGLGSHGKMLAQEDAGPDSHGKILASILSKACQVLGVSLLITCPSGHLYSHMFQVPQNCFVYKLDLIMQSYCKYATSLCMCKKGRALPAPLEQPPGRGDPSTR